MVATEPNGSPLSQLRNFLVERFVGGGELEGFVEENLIDLGPEVGWDGSLASQVRDLTTAIMNHGVLDELWPALRHARPELVAEIDRLAGLDWTTRVRFSGAGRVPDVRWLAAGAGAVVLAIVVGVAVFNGSEGDGATLASTSTTGPEPTVPSLATTTVAPPSSSAGSTPQLVVTSVRAFNGDLPSEQSAIQLLVANRGDAAVNVDRATFRVTKTRTVDCKLLGFTGEVALFARGAELGAYSVPIYDHEDSSDGTVRLTLNPPRRFEPDGEETLVLFDLDETRRTPEGGTTPPYVDEQTFLDGELQVQFVLFEIEITIETTSGAVVDAGTVVVAHPRLLSGLLTSDDISATCGWEGVDVDLEGLDLYSEKLLANRAAVAEFCDSPSVRGQIGANEQLDSLIQAAALCEQS